MLIFWCQQFVFQFTTIQGAIQGHEPFPYPWVILWRHRKSVFHFIVWCHMTECLCTHVLSKRLHMNSFDSTNFVWRPLSEGNRTFSKNVWQRKEYSALCGGQNVSYKQSSDLWRCKTISSPQRTFSVYRQFYSPPCTAQNRTQTWQKFLSDPYSRRWSTGTVWLA